LFLEDCLDLQRIVDTQVQLKVLGVFWLKSPEATLSLVRRLNGRSLCVVGLNRIHGRPVMQYYDYISLHPSLLDLEHAQNFRAILKQSEEVVASRVGMELDWAEVERVVIFIETTPPLDTLEALMLSLSNLPQLSKIFLLVKPGLVRRFPVVSSIDPGFGADVLIVTGLEM
jgi:hypothetical protein